MTMTNETRQTQLEEYVAMYGTLKARTGDAVSAVAILQEMARDARREKARQERQDGKSVGRDSPGNAPATQKQLDWLQDLGVPVARDCTKAQASEMIDQALAREAAR